ncbi:carboxylate/amino acid/amine transporter [Halolamina pelagica]|uniref:Carboxylate/amino acid/amine transporter n=1 Tax=Halolamina pelagica TaxID=699431 RepID=A0A0P7FXV9_9EURY|nr:carboxylate/amino acid/amine transporter [Halolamina pelagica]
MSLGSGTWVGIARRHAHTIPGFETGKHAEWGAFPVSLAALEERVPPMAGLAVAVLAVSTSAILVRWSSAPSVVKAFYRVVFTTALLLPWALGRYRGDFRRMQLRDLGIAGLTGVALALHFAAWFESLNHTSVAASVTLVQTQPLFVAVGAWALLEERLTRRMLAGIFVALFGAAAMSLGDPLLALLGVGTADALAGTGMFGNALALVGAVAAAAYVLAGRSLRQRVSLVPYVVVVYLACAAVLLAIAVAQSAPLVDYPRREWLLFLGMALGPGIFGHTVINWALAHVESGVVSVSLLGEPVGSTVLALLLLPGEIPTPTTIAGGAVVLLGIYITAAARDHD